jgi:two-component sensor histidine kinase
MASLPELARFRTDLDGAAVEHLQRLVAEWGLLADLCFSDLLLWSRSAREPDQFVILDHIRPTTGQTIYRQDRTGDEATAEERPLVARAFAEDRFVEGQITSALLDDTLTVLAIPVRAAGRQVAVLTRESTPTLGRQQGELEVTYVSVFQRLATMVANGLFPFAREIDRADAAPRIGDGVLVLDHEGRIVFTSPNALSALLRLGVPGQTDGLRLADLGLDESAIRRAYAEGVPVSEEIERGSDASVVLRCVPLIEGGPLADGGEVTGGLCMARDISELRRRDRLLLSKDATIREIHHRVKNNLQTISSLLRLQGRRLTSPEAKAAVEESVRRIRSIALVHETLSREAGEDVPFVEIVRPLVRMVEEGYSSPDRPLHFKVRGDAGKLPATLATPLAVVLTELLQNVVDHAYPVGDDMVPGEALVELDNDGRRLLVRVADDGVGVPAALQPGEGGVGGTGLGLQIVRTLVETELAGTISLRRGDGPAERPGTVVELTSPLDAAGVAGD